MKTLLVIFFLFIFNFWGLSQDILNSNGFRQILPSSNKVLITEISRFGGHSKRFITTGDNMSKLWDIPAKKMVAEISNPNDPRTAMYLSCYFHENSKRILQQSATVVNLFEYPSFKLIWSQRMNTYGDLLYKDEWNFWLQISDGKLTKRSWTDGSIIESKQFNDKIDEAGFTEDSSMLFYKGYKGSIAFAEINNPLSLKWNQFEFPNNGKIKNCIGKDFFILDQRFDENNSNTKHRNIAFWLDGTIKSIDSIKSSPEHGIYCNKNQVYYFNDAYYKATPKVYGFSRKEGKIVSSYLPKESGLRNSIHQIELDYENYILWVVYDQSVVGFNIETSQIEYEIPFDGIQMIKNINSNTLILVDKNNNIKIIEDFKKTLRHYTIKSDFGVGIYKVKLIGDYLYAATEKGATSIDLRNLSLSEYYPIPNIKNNSTPVLNHFFDFWEGHYAFQDELEGSMYYFQKDRVNAIPHKKAGYDCHSNILYFLDSGKLMKVNVFDKIENAETITKFKLDSSGNCISRNYDHNTKTLLEIRVANKRQGKNLIYYEDNPIKWDSSQHLFLRKYINGDSNITDIRLHANTLSATILDDGYVISLQEAEPVNQEINKTSIRRRRRESSNYDFVIYSLNENELKEEDRINGIFDLDNFKKVFYHNNLLLFSADSSFILYDLKEKRRSSILTLDTDGENFDFSNFEFDCKKNQVIFYNFLAYNITIDLKQKKIIKNFKAHSWQQKSLGFLSNSGFYTSSDQEVKFWNDKANCLFRLYFHNNGGFILRDSTGFYYSSKSAIKDLHYVDSNLNIVSFDQLDPIFNRPDMILGELCDYFGFKNPELITLFKEAFEKRNKQLNLTQNKNSKFSIDLPTVDISDSTLIGKVTSQGICSLHFRASDPKHFLDRYNIYVNEVPIYGARGIEIPKGLNNIEKKVDIKLSEGDNKIQVSVTNSVGLGNYRYPIYIQYERPNSIFSKTFFIGIGVDSFLNSKHNLQYCVKDVKELGHIFSSNSNTYSIILQNKEATRENVHKLKEILKNTTEQDKVIISCSSHGLLDANNNFYLAMYNVDFNNPELGGLPYDELEWLMDSIPARKKLILLDACNSGENEKSINPDFSYVQLEEHKQGAKGVIVELDSSDSHAKRQKAFQTMIELFVNVNNSTGTTIISAAGGQQSALEAVLVNGHKIENGAFTYCILEFIKKINVDEGIRINGLKKYVEKRVVEITDGKQRPVSRQENMEIDWELME